MGPDALMAAFDAREVVAAANGDYPPFTFTGLDGVDYELPNVLTLTFRQAERLEDDPKDVIAEIAPDAYEALADLPLFAWQKLGEQWQAQAEEAGKSSSASRATRRAAERSKRT